MEFWEQKLRRKLDPFTLRALRVLKLHPEYKPNDEQMRWLFENAPAICELWISGDAYSNLK